MKLVIVGTGYVGLVSGVCLAAKGHDVVCVDIDRSIVERLNAGEPTIHENGLPALLRRVRREGRFAVTTDLAAALSAVELVIIAVGTPSENGAIDLTYVRKVSREIGAYLATTDRHLSVVVKSTVVPGTTDTAVRQEIEQAAGRPFGTFGLGMNPEFLREGEAISDFDDPDRIVIGYEDDQTLARLQELYAPWPVEKLQVNTRTAELIKYANNALLATQISAVNEIANLAASIGGIDVMDVVRGVHLDKRWSPILQGGDRVSPAILTYLMPGCGFGGSCFPKDVQALRSQGLQQGLPMALLGAVLDVNDAQPLQVLDIIKRVIPNLSDRRVLVLGLTFKPGTDDIRESASLKIVAALLEAGATVSAHDPVGTNSFRRALGPDADRVRFLTSWETNVTDSEVIIVATRWPEYQAVTKADLAGKVLFDARRMYRAQDANGATYLTIGQRAL